MSGHWSDGALGCWSVANHSATPPLPHSVVERAGRGNRPRPALQIRRLHVGVARGEHSGEPCRFLFAPALLAWLLKMPVIAHDLQCPFAVNLLLQPPQHFFHWLALFKLNLGQNYLTSSPKTLGRPGPSWPALPFGQAAKHIFLRELVNGQKPEAACAALLFQGMVGDAFAQSTSHFDRRTARGLERQALDHAARH